MGGKTFTGTINIGIDSNGNKHFYEINKIHPTVQRTSSDKSVKMYSNNSIPSNNNVVNNQYMQNGSNNTQNSTQSSFSLSENLPKTDNQNRELTKEQQEYFKDSKVRDEEGRLLEVYHRTNADFDTFDIDKIGYYIISEINKEL